MTSLSDQTYAVNAFARMDRAHLREARARNRCACSRIGWLGAVIKIEVFDDKGAGHTVWSGSDSTKDLNYLIAEFPKTAFKTNRVKLTLATNIVSGWNQIDAVQLIGAAQ